MNMAEEPKNGFNDMVFLKPNHWVALFVAVQAVLIALLIKFKTQQYSLAGSAPAFFYATAPQALLVLAISLGVLKRLGADFSRTWRNWSANCVRDIRLAVVYLAACLALSYLISITGYPWGLPEDKSAFMINNALHWGTPAFLGFLFLICVLAPLAEELFYKRLLYTGVRQGMTARRAIIVCSLLFSLVHSRTTFLLVFALSLLTNYMYERHKRIFANIILHSLLNFFTIVTKVF